MARRYYERDGYSTSELLRYSCDHLACAKKLFGLEPRCYDSAGHLSHLGIELFLKALLLSLIGSFPNEHSLKKLLNEIKSSCPGFKLDLRHEHILVRVNQFKEIRYPSKNSPEIGSEDWPAIEELFNALFDVLPNKIRDDFLESDPTVKGGRGLILKPLEK